MNNDSQYQPRRYECCQCGRVQYVKPHAFVTNSAQCKSCAHKYLRRTEKPLTIIGENIVLDRRGKHAQGPADPDADPPFIPTHRTPGNANPKWAHLPEAGEDRIPGRQIVTSSGRHVFDPDLTPGAFFGLAGPDTKPPWE